MFRIIKKIFSLNNNDKENIELIRNSKYFNEKYYLLENPDIKGDPCKHYYYYGWKEGKSPSFDFSNDYYLKNYKDVSDAGINPLLHYLKFGKAENRIIEKDNGFSLKKAYEKLYNCSYFYKIYLENVNINRVNIFFDKIDESVLKMGNLFKFVSNYIKKYNYKLRIIYSSSDFDILKKCLKENNVCLPDDTLFLNLKQDNYLEIGLNEKYICTSWKNARALLNSSSISDLIYFYFYEFDDDNDFEYYQISSICTNPRVVSLVENDNKIKKIKKCNLFFKTNQKKVCFNNYNQLYCCFDNFFIVGVELINELFLNNFLDSTGWKVNVVDLNNNFKFHFDTNVGVSRVKKIEDNVTFVFQLTFDEQEMNNDYPVVQGYFKKEKYLDFKYINVLDNKALVDFANKHNDINCFKNYDIKNLEKSIKEIEER